MKDIERPVGESADIYELKCLNHSDIKMIRAKTCFERPAYYLIAKDKENGKRNTNKST